MIWEVPGTTIYALFEGTTTGLTGTIAVRVLRAGDRAVVVARTTAGIVEVAPGTYQATFAGGLEAGEYVIVWDLGTPSDPAGTFPEELRVTTTPVGDPGTDWAPSLADVGALLTQRTKTPNGSEPGTFTDQTRPTGEQVANLIASAVSRLTDKIGDGALPGEFVGGARHVSSLYAAMLVELSFFPEQIQAGRSPYNELKALFMDALADLMVGLAESAASDPSTADPFAPSGLPSYSFPALGFPGHASGAELPWVATFGGWV